jgi:hypothetical protein
MQDPLMAPIHSRYCLGDRKLDSFNTHQGIQFALRNTLCYYRKRAIFTFIPKNACSSLRLTLALANGILSNKEQHGFIHKNNHLFAATIRDISECDFSFVILRSPYRRLTSVFIDKFLKRAPLCEKIVGASRLDEAFGSYTFRDFIHAIYEDKKLLLSDAHWIPQSNFLLFEEYTQVFRVEDMKHCSRMIKKLVGVDFIDARPLTKHGSDSSRIENVECAYKLSVNELIAMKKRGFVPDATNFFNNELSELTRSIYKEDFYHYENIFGPIAM